MTQRYHISKDTGRPNICKAKTPESCRLSPAFGEDATPHFESKEEARDYVEVKLSESYSPVSSTNKSRKANENAIDEAIRESVGEYRSNEDFVNEKLPGFKLTQTIEQIDYRNESLLEKDGQHFILNTYGGDWLDYEPLSHSSVKKATASQLATTTTPVKNIESSEIASAIDEILAHSKDTKKTSAFFLDGKGRLAVYSSSAIKELVRDDGSKILTFSVSPEGDSSLLDKPTPVEVAVDLYENEERQNARVMETATVIYDTRVQKGIVFVKQLSSEGYHEDSSFTLKDSKFTSKGSGRLLSLTGDGSIKKAEFWKYA